MRINGNLDKSDCGSGEKSSHSGHILKTQSDFADGMDVGHERKKGVNDDFKVFGLSKW